VLRPKKNTKKAAEKQVFLVFCKKTKGDIKNETTKIFDFWVPF
jgi:hypothetical protein